MAKRGVATFTKFEYADEDIDTYITKLESYFAENKVINDSEKVHILNLLVGADLLRKIFHPSEPTLKSFRELVSVLIVHFTNEQSEMAERFKFGKRDQGSIESVMEYAEELTRLAHTCNFEHIDKSLRDRFVCGLHNATVQKVLIHTKQLTFQKAYTIAQTMEPKPSMPIMHNSKVRQPSKHQSSSLHKSSRILSKALSRHQTLPRASRSILRKPAASSGQAPKKNQQKRERHVEPTNCHDEAAYHEYEYVQVKDERVEDSPNNPDLEELYYEEIEHAEELTKVKEEPADIQRPSSLESNVLDHEEIECAIDIIEGMAEDSLRLDFDSPAKDNSSLLDITESSWILEESSQSAEWPNVSLAEPDPSLTKHDEELIVASADDASNFPPDVSKSAKKNKPAKTPANTDPLEQTFDCDMCGKSFGQRAYLRRHMSCHLVLSLSCDVCQKKFTNRKNLRQHVSTHSGFTVGCEICQKSFSNSHNLRRHMFFHTGQRRYPCDTCGKTFTQNYNLKVHMKLHAGQDGLDCEACERVFPCVDTLRTHLRTHADGEALITALDERNFVCEVCGKMYPTSRSLKRHTGSHSTDRPYACHLCTKTYKEAKILKRHIEDHTGERGFICELCGKRFKKSTTLKAHMTTHSSERPFACGSCEKAFKSPAARYTHTKLVHTLERPFACDVCDKRFALKNTLRTHLVVHTGERRFKCKLCGFALTQSAHLKTHMLTHTKERAFACHLCGKAFALAWNLKGHMITHTGERRFGCDYCKRAFALKRNLKTHMSKHCQSRQSQE